MTLGFERIVSTLARHGVAYVLVGGAAAVAHGSTLPTEDVDVTPARDSANLDHLAAALRELGARIRTSSEPGGVAFPIDGGFLAAMPLMLNLVTDAGDLDITLAPSGFPDGYDTLGPRAIEVEFDDVIVKVAALDDVITSKRAANRAKDRAALPYLEALADEIARGH